MTARIAVIDAEAPNRSYLQLLLGGAGYQVDAASGGNEGIALVEKERPDLVLLDLMMPETDGYTVCERIRKGPAGPATQIVILSAMDALPSKVRALERGRTITWSSRSRAKNCWRGSRSRSIVPSASGSKGPRRAGT